MITYIGLLTLGHLQTILLLDNATESISNNNPIPKVWASLIGFKAICTASVDEVFVFPILQSPPDERLFFRTCQLHTAWELLHENGGNERQAAWHKSQNLAYSEGIGSPAAAIPLLKVV